jgi:hypothetical protein
MFEVGGQIPIIPFRRALGIEALSDDGVDGLFFQDNVNTMIFDKVKLNGLGLFIEGFELLKDFFQCRLPDGSKHWRPVQCVGPSVEYHTFH